MEKNFFDQHKSNKSLMDCLNNKGLKIDSDKQNDSLEFFEKLIKEIKKRVY